MKCKHFNSYLEASPREMKVGNRTRLRRGWALLSENECVRWEEGGTQPSFSAISLNAINNTAYFKETPAPSQQNWIVHVGRVEGVQRDGIRIPGAQNNEAYHKQN